MDIQWFPGHMAKTRRLLTENSRVVDAVFEVSDARIPLASRNPELSLLIGATPRLLILNRADQADGVVSDAFQRFFEAQGLAVIQTDCKTGAGVSRIEEKTRALLADVIARRTARGQVGYVPRAMVVGIPNVGKSSLINRLTGRRSATAENRPGVTRGKQWFRVGRTLELLDTPGVLWPKIEDPDVGLRLAYTGAIRDEILDMEDIGCRLMALLSDLYPRVLSERYRIAPSGDGFALLTQAALARGHLVRGGEADTVRMARAVMDDFRGGKLGRLSLERPIACG